MRLNKLKTKMFILNYLDTYNSQVKESLPGLRLRYPKVPKKVLLNKNFLYFDNLMSNNFITSHTGSLIKAHFEVPFTKKNCVVYPLSEEFYYYYYRLDMILYYIILSHKVEDSLVFNVNFAPYLDILRFCIHTFMNIYWPWLESSLASKFFALQYPKLSSREGQMSLLNITGVLYTRFIVLSSKPDYIRYKHMSIVNSKMYHKGRTLNTRFCNTVRESIFDKRHTAITLKPYNNMGVLSDYTKSVFTTKWGVGSIKVLYNFKDLR